MKTGQIKLSNIKGDVFGGITAGIVALPLALAFGVQSGLGAAAGLYGAITLGIVAAIFGGTPSQISGPTGPMTVVTASIIALSIQKAGNFELGVGMVIFSFFMAGVFQVIFGLIKLGKYIRYIPYPVVSGFMSGIGLIIILLQIFPLVGAKSPGTVINVIHQLPQLIQQINYQALLLGLLTILTIYILPLITKVIPGTLIALLLFTIISVVAGFDVPVIGNIPKGIPEFRFLSIFDMNWQILLSGILPALTLAGLGSIDTLLTSVVADNITKSKHKSNKELIGQGLGNIAASLFGGLPGAGATMRTVINVRNGGKTGLSGVIHGLILIIVLLGAGQYVKEIPNSVLAGILITVGIGIIDIKGLKDLFAMPKADALVLVIVLLLTVFLDLLQAVGVGMVIASVLFMKRASDLVDAGTDVSQMKKSDKELAWDDEGDITEEMLKEIYIQRLDGPVFFGSVTKFQELMAAIPKHAKVVIIRMRKVPFMDLSGLYAMETAVKDLTERGVVVLITIVQPQPLYMLQKINVVPGLIPENHCFKTFEDCALWLKNDYFVKKSNY